MDDESYSAMVVELWSEFDDWAPLVVAAADSSSAAFDDVAVDVDDVAADGDIDIAVVVVDIVAVVVAVVVGAGGVDGGEAPHPPRSTFPTVKTFLKTKKIFAHYIYDNLEQQSKHSLQPLIKSDSIRNSFHVFYCFDQLRCLRLL